MTPAMDCHGCDICSRCEREIQDAADARHDAISAVCEFLEREGYRVSAREARHYFGVEQPSSTREDIPHTDVPVKDDTK